jgi:2-dehydropantoate 2-reductase
MTDKIKVTVLGSGAMGSFYGTMFQDAGCDVMLLDIWKEHIDRLNEVGLELTGPDGKTRIVSVSATSVETEGVRTADLVIVFVDTNALEDVLPRIESLLAPDGVVLTLQNGVGNLEKLSDALGSERVIAGTSMNSCELSGPGKVRHVIHGETTIGEIGGKEISERTHQIGNFLSKVDDKIDLVADIVPHVWSKLIINCAINPLCALTGLLPGELQEHADTRKLQQDIVAEIVALCDRKGIHLPEADPIAEVWRKSRGSANKPSMVQHLERDRQTEINALNGAVVRMALEVDLTVPTNATVTNLIKGLEDGKGIDFQLN